MTADQLLGHLSRHALQRALVALLEQQREKDHLEEDVAELVAQLLVIAQLRGLCQLVGLLNGVRHDRALVLLTVPGALASQSTGDLVEALERVERQRASRRSAEVRSAARPR